MGLGRYHDEWVRERGRWRVRSRRHGVESAPLRPEARCPETSDPAVRYLLDRDGIADRVAAFGAGLDRGERDLAASCMTSDPRVERPDGVSPSPGAFLDSLSEGGRSGPRTHHYVGNQLVQFDDEGAWVETYLYLSHDLAEGGYSPWHENALRWEQRLVRDAGSWRIAEHRVCDNRVETNPGS